MLEEGDGAYVALFAPERDVPEAHAPLPVAEEYHWYEKVEVPPDSCDVSPIDWPLSIDGADGVTVPAVRTGLTVTRSQVDPEVSEPAALLSVTT